MSTTRPNGTAPYTAETRALALSGERVVAVTPRLRAGPPQATRQAGPVLPSQLVRGRQTAAEWGGVLAHQGWRTIPRRAYARVDLTRLNVATMPLHQVMEILSDVSHDVSQALWNNLLMTNSGYEFAVLHADGNPDEEGQAILEGIIERVNPHAGGLDGIIDQWHHTAYLQGAMAGEVVLNGSLSDVEDIFPVSPWTIEFERDEPYPRPVQRLPWEHRARELNPLTFYYLPILPAVDDPYGRAPFVSVLTALSFDLQMMVDLRVAMHANAWDRLDVTVLESVVVEAMPQEERLNPEKRRQWVQAVIDQVRTGVTDMRADDTLIHTDATTITPIAGGTRNVAAIQVFRMLERRVIRGLKQLPVLMGSNEGTTETHGTIQFEIYVDGIRAVQDRTKHMLESMLTVAMQVHGRQSRVVMNWKPIRTVDRFREARSEWQEIQNAAAKRDQGWITQDAASESITGSPAVADAPRASTLDSSSTPADDDVDVDEDTENDGDGRARVLPAGQRATDESQTQAWRESEARIAALLERYFRTQEDAFPADDVASEVLELYGDDGELVTDDDVRGIATDWFATVAALVLAESLAADVGASYVRAYNAAGQRVLRQLGISGTFKLTNESIIASLEQRAVLQVAGFDDWSRKRLARVIARGVRDGLTVDELALRIKRAFREMSDARALAIAQTETTDLWGRVVPEVARRNGLSDHTWNVERDDRLCEVCMPNDGVTVVIGHPFPSGHTAPSAHVNCRCWLELVIPRDWEAPDEPWRGE